MEALRVESFRPESKITSVRTSLKLAYQDRALTGCFFVEDPCFLARYQGFQQPVFKDSCVELFLQPHGQGGYFNFEFNALGAMLLYWIEDPVREGSGFRRYTILPAAHCQQVEITPSLTKPVDAENPRPLAWSLGFRIPISLLEIYAGKLAPLSGQHWRGNAYKCGDETSHPHWVSWAPVGGELDFHQPDYFGDFLFE